MGKSVVAVDLGPQTNLATAFLDEERIEKFWTAEAPGSTIFQAVRPLSGVGDISDPNIVKIINNLFLLPGDVGLSGFEDALSNEWPL